MTIDSEPESLLTAETAEQFEHRRRLESVPLAARDVVPAIAEYRIARRRVGKLRLATWYYAIRVLAARAKVSAWLAALIGSSLLAVAVALVQVFVTGTDSMALCIAIFFSYSVCGGALLWLLRSTAIETDENRRQVRAGELERSRNLLLSVRESLDLREAERRLKTERLLSIDPDHLSPEQFENYVAAIFSNLGYTTEVIGKSGDQGVDVVACSGPIRIAIQAKRYTGSVGNFAVQEVYTGMAHHKCHRCLVVTTSDFTPRAVDLVSSTNCLLIGRDQLRALIRGELAI